jgi:hypothetical protein
MFKINFVIQDKRRSKAAEGSPKAGPSKYKKESPTSPKPGTSRQTGSPKAGPSKTKKGSQTSPRPGTSRQTATESSSSHSSHDSKTDVKDEVSD